jgi:hypothetical protein
VYTLPVELTHAAVLPEIVGTGRGLTVMAAVLAVAAVHPFPLV